MKTFFSSDESSLFYFFFQKFSSPLQNYNSYSLQGILYIGTCSVKKRLSYSSFPLAAYTVLIPKAIINILSIAIASVRQTK